MRPTANGRLSRGSCNRALRTATLLVLGLASGCGKGPTIPGTEIPSTEENIAVIDAVERYRVAFVTRDAAAVIAAAHPTYYDDSGTDDPGDDVTYQELGPILRKRMAQLESVRFTIDYLDLHVDKDRAIVKVWIDASFRIAPVEGDAPMPRDEARYARLQDHNMFELVRDGKSWLITSGM